MTTKSQKYTDDALSRVLGEHAIGTLVPGGSSNWEIRIYCGIYGIACANQAAFNTDGSWAAWEAAPDVADWFDLAYRSDMTPEALLAGIEERYESTLYR